MKRETPRKHLVRDRAHKLVRAAGLTTQELADRAGYSLRQTLYALDGRRSCPERIADVLRDELGEDGFRFICGEIDKVTITKTYYGAPLCQCKNPSL